MFFVQPSLHWGLSFFTKKVLELEICTTVTFEPTHNSCGCSLNLKSLSRPLWLAVVPFSPGLGSLLQVLVGVAPDLLGEDQVALAGGVVLALPLHELGLHPVQVH